MIHLMLLTKLPTIIDKPIIYKILNRRWYYKLTYNLFIHKFFYHSSS